MRIKDNEYAKICKELYDYVEKNKWSTEKYHNWLRKHNNPHTFTTEVKKLIGEL